MYNYLLYTFLVNIVIAMSFNGVNILAYDFRDIYFSVTLLYASMLMFTNSLWGYQIIRYLSYNKFSTTMFSAGIIATIIVSLLLRNQVFVDDKQYLRRMISYQSATVQASSIILEKLKNNVDLQNDNESNAKKKVIQLAETIFKTQKPQILKMKKILQELND